MKNYLGLAALTLTAAYAQAQELPKASSEAFLKQRIGLTDITVTYSRPNVNNREVFGELVSYRHKVKKFVILLTGRSLLFFMSLF